MKHIACIVSLLVLFISPAVIAQSGIFGMEGDDAAPSEELPALPVVEEEEAPDANMQQAEGVEAGMVFPELPPSRWCSKRDVLGLWQLVMVFQVPPGEALEDFGIYPYQYTLFNGNSTFRRYKSATNENAHPEIMRILQDSVTNKVLEQFVVDKTGVLYLYKDGVAVDSMACFIVANPADPFHVGQMIFMPPPDKAHIRKAHVFEKVYSAPKAGRNKGNKNRKNRRNRKNR